MIPTWTNAVMISASRNSNILNHIRNDTVYSEVNVLSEDVDLKFCSLRSEFHVPQLTILDQQNCTIEYQRTG
jgi:hypothetical protein